MVVLITGAAGFIGSYVANRLQELGIDSLHLVDDFSPKAKLANHQHFSNSCKIHRDTFFQNTTERIADWVLHLGARTDTAETRSAIFNALNYEYSQHIWEYCTKHQIPLIYASSAATYGNGSLGYSDTMDDLTLLQPLNAYGWSKQQFDVWAKNQATAPPHWYGLKFFNVYGPHESHKGRMASVIFHAYHQIKQTQKLRLFKSHRSDCADGMQKRDFIFVEDIFQIIWFLMQQQPASSGILNAGTGAARSFLDLGHAVFSAMGQAPQIEFIDIPADIRSSYQYFTQANMQKLQQLGYNQAFTSLETGTQQYISYLLAQENN